jgi:hypothetical protein
MSMQEYGYMRELLIKSILKDRELTKEIVSDYINDSDEEVIDILLDQLEQEGKLK